MNESEVKKVQTETITLNDTTFVSSAQPNSNFSYYPFMYVGTAPSFGQTIGLMQFTLPWLPVSEVDSAVLTLYVYGKTGTAPSTVVVNRVTAPYNTNTVTYNNQPTFVPTANQVVITQANVNTTVDIDITSIVNDWLSGSENNGIAFTNTDGTTSVQFATTNLPYQHLYPKLVITYTATPGQALSYAYVYNTNPAIVDAGSPIPFNTNGALLGFTHEADAGEIVIENPGTYALWYSVTGADPNQFAVFRSGSVVPGSVYGTDSSLAPYTGKVIFSADAGDEITIVNTSGSSISLDNPPVGSETGVNASVMIIRVGPSASSNPALEAVNTAQDITEMRSAIEDPALGLDLSQFNGLSTVVQDQVLTMLLNNRPTNGYPTVQSVQEALDYAIDHVVNPDNIYVEAGSSGDGSKANPFGAISQGIAAVNPGGTVNILAGTYPITSQILVNKDNITLKGEPGTVLRLDADLVPLMVTGSGVTIEGLTMTSNDAYAKEFIQVGGTNNRIINNTIYGPLQPPPMDDWVVNRAVVSQVATNNILLEGNTFYQLRTGMYINPNTTGAINDNVVYNTKGGFLVDGAFTTFSGNSWGTPPNEFDIVLLAGTTFGPPYDNLAALSAENNNATISDQRTP